MIDNAGFKQNTVQPETVIAGLMTTQHLHRPAHGSLDLCHEPADQGFFVSPIQAALPGPSGTLVLQLGEHEAGTLSALQQLYSLEHFLNLDQP